MSFLKHQLDSFIANFPREKHLVHDPVHFVHRYDDARDREVAGLLASAFAYGNVKSVLSTVEKVLGYLGPFPSRTIASFSPRSDVRKLRGFYHRFNTSRDLAVLFWIIRRTLEDYEQFYPRGELGRRNGVRFFFPNPSEGSACKRLNLYLRWMVRPEDGIDCGVWTAVKPRQLVIPLDTHIARISSYIGLTRMRSPGWAMALDITRHLRRLHPDDPVRYDFALCHLGIAGDCPRKRDLQKCAECPIVAICRL